MLFTDTTGEYQLEIDHINCIKEFLHANVRPFSLISKDQLETLIKKSEVLDFETDDIVFSHVEKKKEENEKTTSSQL